VLGDQVQQTSCESRSAAALRARRDRSAAVARRTAVRTDDRRGPWSRRVPESWPAASARATRLRLSTSRASSALRWAATMLLRVAPPRVGLRRRCSRRGWCWYMSRSSA